MSDAEGSPAPRLRTSAGMVELGRQVVVHGSDLHHDCLGLSFVHYLLFCVTGRRFPEAEVRALEQMWIATGYPDARIWCNRIAGYMGSARVDPAFSVCAALAACNGVGYGFRAMRLAREVQEEIPEPSAERLAWLMTQLRNRRVLSGYGRPLHGHDERIDAALQVMADARLRAGPALQRAHWLHRELGTRKRLEMNISAFWAAYCIDLGISRPEYDQFMLLMFVPGYAAVYADQHARPPLSFLRGYQTRPVTGSNAQPPAASGKDPSPRAATSDSLAPSA